MTNICPSAQPDVNVPEMLKFLIENHVVTPRFAIRQTLTFWRTAAGSLLTGATLGGNLTPIGASANIAAIGILRKQGEQVRTRDFLRIGIPFTLAAVLTGYVYLWLVWGA